MSSYQVFARKYRPRTFDDVIGQEHITQTLKNAIEQNRLAHAYLFVGPRGTGKTSTARILAMALNCDTGHGKPTTTPCGVCDSCREISQGNSLDVLEFDAASNTQVDKIREIIIDNVKFAPTKGAYKLYLVDEVHMLSNSSFNALLKTLEEPPSHVKFLFATTDPQKVPVTILSRCQRFDLKRIPDTLIANHLQFIATQEKISLSDSAAAAIARGADGGLRDAESMLDQLVAFCGEAIDEEDVLKIFGFTSQESINALTEHILRIETPQALSLIHAQAESGKDLMKVLTDLLGHLRNLLIFQVDPSSLDREISNGLRSILQEQAGFVSGPKLLDLIQQLSAAEGRMKWAANKKLQLEIAIIRATQSLQVSSLDDVLLALQSLRDGSPMPTAAALPPPRSMPPASVPPPPQKPLEVRSEKPKATPPVPVVVEKLPVVEVPNQAPPIEAPVEVTLPDAEFTQSDTIEDLWPKLIREVSTKRKMIVSFLEAAAPELGPDDTLTLAFPESGAFAMENLQRPASRQFLEAIISDLRGKKTALQCVARAGAQPSTISYATPDEPIIDPMEAFKNDPLIQKALDIFKAEITSVVPATTPNNPL